MTFSYLNEDVGADRDLERVVAEQERLEIHRVVILHQIRAEDFDDVDVEGADGEVGPGAVHQEPAVDPEKQIKHFSISLVWDKSLTNEVNQATITFVTKCKTSSFHFEPSGICVLSVESFPSSCMNMFAA